MIFHLRDRQLKLEDPVIMGVINVTPDSFSDGGRYFGRDKALRRAQEMVAEGAHILDVGGESTRPGAQFVGLDEELDRVLPVVEKIKDEFDVLVSIDTYKEQVARVALAEAGVDIINDISALTFDENMAKTVARFDVPLILMHIKGTPEKMQVNPHYDDVVSEVKQYFLDRIGYAVDQGIKREKLILDPGIGFGKRFNDNAELLRRLEELREFNLPILMGLSRKSFLGTITGEKDPLKRETETAVANLVAIKNGASVVRVHDVKNTLKAIKVLHELDPMF